MAMISNMKATGRSAEETEAALSQLFLSCPMTNPEAEEVEVNVDEFEHTKVEQRARRDQQRVLAALARHRQRPPRFDPTVHGMYERAATMVISSAAISITLRS